MTKLDNILKSREITLPTKAHLVKGPSVSPHPMYQLYQTQCMYDITATVCMIPYAPHMTSQPHFMTSHHFMYDIRSNISDITSTISDLTSTVSVSSHQHYRWYHSHYMYDITSCICVTSYLLYLWHHIHYVWITTLCVDDTTLGISDIICTSLTSHPLYHTTQQYLWCHIHFKHDIHTHWFRHRTHCIFDITTSLLISYPLLNDITSTICVTSYALYITSHLLLMSSHYCTYDITTSIYETTSSM